MSSPNPVATQEEINAALAQAEALSLDDGQIPSLDDNQPKKVVPIPVPPVGGARIILPPVAPAADSPAVSATEASESAVADAGSAETVAADAGPVRQGFLSRILSWLRLRRRHEPVSSVAPSAGEPAGAPNAATRMNVALRALDLVLDLLNRPFARLGPSAKRAIAIVAIMSIVISAAARILAPRLVTHKDAVSLLRRQVAALSAPAAPTQTASESKR